MVYSTPSGVHVEAAVVALVGIGTDAQRPLPFHFAVEAQALHFRPAPTDDVKRLRRFAHAEGMRRRLVDVRQGEGPDDLAVGIDLQDAVAMLVQPVEVAAGPCLDAGGGIPADLVADEEIGHGLGLLELLVVDRHLVGEMPVGGGDQAVGVGSGVVNRGHRRPAQLVLAVAADAEDVAAVLPCRGEIDHAVAADREVRLRAVELGVLAGDDLLEFERRDRRRLVVGRKRP